MATKKKAAKKRVATKATKRATRPRKAKAKFTFANGKPFYNGTDFLQLKDNEPKAIVEAKSKGFRSVSFEFFIKHSK